MKRLALMGAVAAALVGAYLGLRAQKQADDADTTQAKALIGVDLDAANRIVFVRRDQTPRVVEFAQRDGEWWLARPITYPASRTGMKSMLQQLGELKVDRTLDDAASAEFGLDRPAYHAAFYAVETSATVRVGKATPFGGELYVARSGSPGVGIIAQGFEYQFAKEPKQWRTPSLFLSAFPATVASAHFATEASSWTLTRTEDGWTGGGYALDAGLVEALMTRIGNLDVRTYLSDDAATELGNYRKLDPPLRRLEITAADGRRYDLHFGQGPLEDGTVPVHVTWRDQIVAVSAYAYEGLWRTPAQLAPVPEPTTAAADASTAGAMTPLDELE